MGHRQGWLRDRLYGHQRDAAGLWTSRHAARERRRTGRPADHSGRLGARGDHTVGKAFRAWADRNFLRPTRTPGLWLPDMDLGRQGTPVHAARAAEAVYV